MKKYKVLLVDYRSTRLKQITSLLNFCDGCCVDSRLEISRNDLEQGDYDIIIVHSGNDPESGCIENNEWDTGDAKIILFSGDCTQLEKYYDGILYVRPDYFESQSNILKLLKKESVE